LSPEETALAREIDRILELMRPQPDLALDPEDTTEYELLHRVLTANARIPIPAEPAIMRRGAGRDLGIGLFGFAVPTAKTISGIRRYGPVVEVGAGTGYWSYLLRRAGADVVVTDKSTIENTEYHWNIAYTQQFSRSWVSDLIVMDASEAARKYCDRSLLMVWPCYNKPWGHNALKAYYKAGGQTFIYVGEDSGGCTGDDNLHKYISTHWKWVETLPMKSWTGMHDVCTVWRRKDQ
jgi:hypothetical protein